MSHDKADIRVVDLRLLGIDPSYQRALKDYHRRIAKNFDPAAVGVLHVAKRPDGSLWVIDGQQRRAAMLAVGVTHWPAQVIDVAGVEDEARLFNRLGGGEGTKRNIGEADKFRALLTARNPLALAAVEAVAAGGLTLGATKHRNWPNLCCLRLVQSVMSVAGADVVRRSCLAISRAWPQQADALYDTVFGGLANLIQRNPSIKDDRLADRLAKQPPLKLVNQANSSVGCRFRAFAGLAAQVYNSGLKNPANRVDFT